MTTVSTTTPSAQGSEGGTRTANVLPIAGFVQIPVSLLPALFSLSPLALKCYLALVARCDGWTRRGRDIPRLKSSDVAETIGSSRRRAELAIAECKRAGLVATLADPRDPRGCQYVLSKTSSSDPKRSQLEPEAWNENDRSSGPSSDPFGSMLAPDTLLRSRSTKAASPHAHAHAHASTRTREGEGGRPVFDDLTREVLELFAEPRWYRHGASYMTRKLEPLRALGTSDQILRFVQAQLKEPAVKAARFPPGLACDPDGFRGWLELERRRHERAKTIASSASSASSAPAAAPRITHRPELSPAALECAATIWKGLK